MSKQNSLERGHRAISAKLDSLGAPRAKNHLYRIDIYAHVTPQSTFVEVEASSPAEALQEIRDRVLAAGGGIDGIEQVAGEFEEGFSVYTTVDVHVSETTPQLVQPSIPESGHVVNGEPLIEETDVDLGGP